MVDQQSTSKRTVGFAGLAVILAIATFSVAFYLFDGVGLVTGLIGGGSDSPGVTASKPTTAVAEAPSLPDAVPEEFALRLWQEQIDSQPFILKMANGEVTSLKISGVESDSDIATLTVTARLNDKTSVPGVIGLRKFEDQWYVAFASSSRDGRIIRPSGDLPNIADVDIALLSTIFEQQDQSQEVIAEYLSGNVTEVLLQDVQRGPNTVTIPVEMIENHGEGYANIVLIKSETTEPPLWFLARFTKTGHDPANL